MKNFFESLKDILYDSMDYIIMLAIVIGVVSVIGWRLDILFAKDAMDTIDTNAKIEETIPPTIDDEKEDITKDTTEDNSESITIEIPEGSLPSQIGSILEEHELVESADEFVQRAQNMDLDRKFRSGIYTFDKDNTLEDIIKIIARED